MKIRAFSFLLPALLLLGRAPSAFPDDPSSGTCADGQTKTVEVEANVRVDSDFNPDAAGDTKYSLRLKKVEGQASIRLFRDVPCKVAQEILLVIKGKMEQDVIVNGVLDANHMNAADYLKEAYIELKRVGGLPIAIIVGTTDVSYGQDYHGTLDFNLDASHAMADGDQGKVKGFTVVLDKELIKIFDDLELSVFTSNPDFFGSGVSQLDGFAFRVNKTIAENLDLEASYLHKENSYKPTLEPETKVSLGATFHSGLYTIWGEGVAMRNSKEYANADFGVTAGVRRITGPGRIDLEATAIQRTLKQYAAGYELFITKHLTVGPTFRYTYCVSGNAGCMAARGYGQGPSIGFSGRYTFGEGSENPTWLGRKGKPVFKKLFRGRDRDKN
jgi:hypothetical protein